MRGVWLSERREVDQLPDVLALRKPLLYSLPPDRVAMEQVGTESLGLVSSRQGLQVTGASYEGFVKPAQNTL